MAETTVPLTARVPEEERDAVEDLAEERAKSKSAMTRELVQRGIETIDEDDSEPERHRSTSPLTILGVVAIAVAPTLLATGYTGLGLGLGVFAAAYVLLWATAYDVVVERRLEAARDALDEAGGVVGFFRVMWFDHHVEDPDTVIERAARLDLYAPVALVLSALVGGVLALLRAVGYFEPLLALIGPWGAWGIALLVVGLMYLFALMLGISAIATVAVATSRSDADVVEDPAES